MGARSPLGPPVHQAEPPSCFPGRCRVQPRHLHPRTRSRGFRERRRLPPGRLVPRRRRRSCEGGAGLARRGRGRDRGRRRAEPESPLPATAPHLPRPRLHRQRPELRLAPARARPLPAAGLRVRHPPPAFPPYLPPPSSSPGRGTSPPERDFDGVAAQPKGNPQSQGAPGGAGWLFLCAWAGLCFGELCLCWEGVCVGVGVCAGGWVAGCAGG